MTIIAFSRPVFDLTNPETCILDLDNPKAKEVTALVGTFEEAIRANPDLGPLPVHTGWNDISPSIAVNLLMRNRPGANRKVDPGTVLYYARQMRDGKWLATGQAILVDADDVLQDAQHRLLAGLISGVSFRSYVVTGIEPKKNLFASIDNGRVRRQADALRTAGYNGVSQTIVAVIKIGEEVRLGVYSPSSGLKTLPRQTPAETLELVDSYPNARKAARSASSDWEEATELLLGRKNIVAYLGMRIIDLHGEDKADNFFEEVSRPLVEHASDSPIHALLKLAEREGRADKAMKPRHMLAAMIKVFNAWHTNEPLGRRWTLLVDEEFPSVVSSNAQVEAAE